MRLGRALCHSQRQLHRNATNYRAPFRLPAHEPVFLSFSLVFTRGLADLLQYIFFGLVGKGKVLPAVVVLMK